MIKSKKIVTKFNLTGECKISIKNTIAQWNEDYLISQWNEEYTLCRVDKNAENFTKTNLKARISKLQAHELIAKLDLVCVNSPIFKSGKTWVLNSK